jgi:hypothetical protein
LPSEQGDQIGLNFAYIFERLFSLGRFLKMAEVSRISGHFLRGKSVELISTTNGLGHILGVFSQTHLVTLLWRALDRSTGAAIFSAIFFRD